MINWGYSINQPRVVNLDTNDSSLTRDLLRMMPQILGCIGCGGCTATCTAGRLAPDFNFRRVHTLIRRGEYKGAYEQIAKCMMCGKCRLVCPRGINTRGMAMLIKNKLGQL